jgi:hypothetical protein
MFEILRTARADVAAEAAYRVGLRIYEREYFSDWRKWLPLRPNDGPFAEAVAVAADVLEEIEHRTGKPLASLTNARLKPYERRIRRIMEQRRRAEFPLDNGVGERILQELRRDYGRPDWRAVA